jgi:N utilization substance protein B
MGSRHAARRFAVQALYALEMNPETTPLEAVERALEALGDRAADREFVEALVAGAWERRAELDETIQRYSRRWKLQRMDRVDKSVLRLAAHELLHRPETPAPVILDESVELAKEFGSDDSPAFVNGILDRIAHECRQPEFREQQG